MVLVRAARSNSTIHAKVIEMSESIVDQVAELNERLMIIEERFAELGYDMRKMVVSETNKRWKIQPQAETQFGLFTALCIDTIDPWKQNRVRFFSPLFHTPETPIKALPWCDAISVFGGFDDSGVNWVPPAGSTLCILFENGSRATPFYVGTTWHRNRGPDGNHNWGYPIQEYYELWEGRRNGYLVGANDGSQVLPPWNTENYNGFDITSITDFEDDPDAQDKITNPNVYGFKTNGKHHFKLVDGDPKCKHRWARAEWQSITGNIIMMKDDHLRPCGQWAHPQCACGGGDLSKCPEKDEEADKCETGVCEKPKCANPYFKHENECRFYRGPQTPQNNHCELCQSGIQFMSQSGHTLWMDDSVEEPKGEPDWMRAMRPFDFGCTDLFLGKTAWVSATGHRIEMNDKEERTQLRGEENYIRIISANGNKIELNDHTVGIEDCPGCPPNVAGNMRGIHMQSTSNHTIDMVDEENEQCAPCRREGGAPINKAKKGYVRIRTGYGLMITMQDDFNQQDTEQQHIMIFCPHYDNEERGPHIMRFQEVPSGPGYVFLKVGGDYICMTYDNHFTIVGDLEQNPSNKIVYVTDTYVEITEQVYINMAKNHMFIADEIIALIAGTELDPRCKTPTGGCTACVWPVLCLSPKGITISDRVFVSASPDAGCASIMQLIPFHKCPPIPAC